ncbi:MAG: hypothetical protein N2511_07065 [Thermodesulfovibrionales bacterium]|nr:hypothetical protein [Thermodesulfovibrionales bacterium]
MRNLIKILSKNPDLIRIDNFKEKTSKKRYASSIHYDRLYEVAREYAHFAKDIPLWRVDYQTIEQNFNFGIRIAQEIKLTVEDVGRLFNEHLPKFFDGGCIGFFVSGVYHKTITEKDVLKLNLRAFKVSVSGLGYRHPAGRLEIIGDKAYYLGIQMEDGEIQVFGNTGNHIGGKMRGGMIVIHGSARNFVGEQMEGGKIVIKGNAIDAIGIRMVGGEIVIEGKAGHWIGAAAKGGKITFSNFFPYPSE